MSESTRRETVRIELPNGNTYKITSDYLQNSEHEFRNVKVFIKLQETEKNKMKNEIIEDILKNCEMNLDKMSKIRKFENLEISEFFVTIKFYNYKSKDFSEIFWKKFPKRILLKFSKCSGDFILNTIKSFEVNTTIKNISSARIVVELDEIFFDDFIIFLKSDIKHDWIEPKKVLCYSTSFEDNVYQTRNKKYYADILDEYHQVAVTEMVKNHKTL